jgi:hypothetical protein
VAVGHVNSAVRGAGWGVTFAAVTLAGLRAVVGC